MHRILLIAAISLLSLHAAAQSADSTFAIKKAGTWTVKYTLKPHENITMLAHRYYITAEDLTSANNPDLKKKWVAGDIVYIPLGPNNFFVHKQPLEMDGMHELYYHVAAHDDIGLISTYSGITKKEMITMNSLHGNTLTPDQVLFIGYVRIMPHDSSNTANGIAYPGIEAVANIANDTAKHSPGGLDTIYRQQTNDGMNVLTEKGTAVFFEKPGKSNIYYAFHNTTKRGTVIKVYNPGTNKTIYVKVLGPIPDTKLYANCILGISSTAKQELGVSDSKAWCELSYPAN